MKGKVKFQNKRGNSSEKSKKIDKFQEKHVKHGVSNKFRVILRMGKSYVKLNQNDFDEQFYPF